MENVHWTTTFRGLKVIESRLCVEQKIKRRAVAVVVDQRRPNKTKPIYKMKTFITTKPTAYLLKGQNTLIAHPDFLRAVQKKMSEQMSSAIDNMARSALMGEGSTTTVPSDDKKTLTTEDWKEMIEALSKPINAPAAREWPTFSSQREWGIGLWSPFHRRSK